MTENIDICGSDVCCLVLSSGGARAFPVMIACMEMLLVQRKLKLENIRVVRGTSAGAAVALAIALRMNIKELREECTHALTTAGTVSFHPPNLFTKFGGSSHEGIAQGLSDMIKRKGADPSLTFRQLYEKTSCSLCTVATNAIDGTPIICSLKQTPNARVLDAVLASMAIPFMLSPYRFKLDPSQLSTERLCVDGALTYPYPVAVPGEDELSRSQTIGIRVLTLRSVQNPKMDLASLDFMTYAANMTSMLFAKFEQTDTAGFFTIQVECPMRGTGFHLAQSTILTLEAAALLATSRASNSIQSIETGLVSIATQTDG
jgi:predicted acylesterase/phospholipase RssA